MACVYPDARTPGELWENVLAQRRAFRPLPPERLRKEDYWSPDRQSPDRSYTVQAAVIDGYKFDRVAFRVAGSTFRSGDLAHWLALDVASRALADAGFTDGRGLPKESTGALVGNTLTGEFSRAGLMRLRWPYVRRTVDAALAKKDWDSDSRRTFLEELEAEYKSPFEPVGEETLAGGLSNTIAGRICNYFDLKGGGYTVDGACASSLLATANACSALAAGDLDAALAGGVDVSLDPFELVGFAKAGALAADEMRVFDRRSAGFWPGEGCGFVVLMRHEDAVAQGCRVYAVIRGWGISSDGSGGITRPEAAGQLEAIRRAYRRAGFGADTVAYCEGHGTGTNLGDLTELEVLARARKEANVDAPAAAVGSIKANIGHTKAAAGVAGLIKATMTVHTQVLPPATACEQPLPLCEGRGSALRILREAEVWPEGQPLRASVSAMGFGGINCHVIIESPAAQRRRALSTRERSLSSSAQDSELFLFASETIDGLRSQIQKSLSWAARICRSELADAAERLETTLQPGNMRAAIVARTGEELSEKLQTILSWLRGEESLKIGIAAGVFLACGQSSPRIGFLFPGQGSPVYLEGGAWQRRFDTVRQSYAAARLASDGDGSSTRIMQPAVVTASMAGLRVLESFGIRACSALGHSLGEITALHWAGVLSEEALLRIAKVRGAAMAELGNPAGMMVAVAAPQQQVQQLLQGEGAWLVAMNSPRQNVIAGTAHAVDSILRRAALAGLRTSLLPVSHAFHTPLVAAASPLLAEQLAREDFSRLSGNVISTIKGRALDSSDDLRELLCRQLTLPVRFTEAMQEFVGLTPPLPGARNGDDSKLDLLIEVGPGSVLGGLAREIATIPVVSLDAGGPSLQGLLEATAAGYVLGAPVVHSALFAGRFTRPFDPDRKPKFFANPCETRVGTENLEGSRQLDSLLHQLGVPASTGAVTAARATIPERFEPAVTSNSAAPGNGHTPASRSAFDVVRELVAERAELPVAAVQKNNRMLGDLHLNSITVGQIVSEAARRLSLPRITSLTDFANSTVDEIGRALNDLQLVGNGQTERNRNRQPSGAGPWVAAFGIKMVETKRGTTQKAVSRTTASRRPAPGSWQLLPADGHLLAGPLKIALDELASSGVAVCLPEEPGEEHLRLLLEGARVALGIKPSAIFLLVQHGWGGSAFARTLYLENPGLTVCVVNVPPRNPQSIQWIAAEAASASGYTEAHYDATGRRTEPRLIALEDGLKTRAATRSRKAQSRLLVDSRNVLLVTGGGKGIAAECALALGRETGAKLALLGRSDPKLDPELASNLKRIKAAGLSCAYFRADVTDAVAVSKAIKAAEKKLGRVAGVLHGAGANTPQLIASLTEEAFRHTLAPKIQGARNVLAALDRDRLRLFVTFSSIIARTGLPGEADYATANEWLTRLTERFQEEHPRCLCLALEWSVWAGVGMGDRLGRIESLVQQGIMPIAADEGVAKLIQLLKSPPRQTALVVSGRFGEPPALKMKEPELPLRRFLERKRVYYPGVELVVDADLSIQTDPYLNDHIVQRERLFPAVLGLEAMAQTAMALVGTEQVPSFEQIKLPRPVVINEHQPTIIRLAALRRGPGLVEVCLRSEGTDFGVDHFRVLCRFAQAERRPRRPAIPAPARVPLLRLDPASDLYGRILFHEGRFRRVNGYRSLKATECVAEIKSDGNTKWFGPYLPEHFVLGDPGARDAALHAIQACIPHHRILPLSIERLSVFDTRPGARVMSARETAREGNTFTYDLEIANEHGRLVERWTGLKLRAIEPMPARTSWPAALAAPYLERRVQELLAKSSISVALEQNGNGSRRLHPLPHDGRQSETTFFIPEPGARSVASDAAMQRAIGKPTKIWRRPDGRPTAWNGKKVSASHQDALTLAIAGNQPVACDLEAVSARPRSVWRDLLGERACAMAEKIAGERSEALDSSASRLWTVLECLKKAGAPVEAPLVFETTEDGWLVLRSGDLAIASCLIAVQGMNQLMAVALAVSSANTTHPP